MYTIYKRKQLPVDQLNFGGGSLDGQVDALRRVDHKDVEPDQHCLYLVTVFGEMGWS